VKKGLHGALRPSTRFSDTAEDLRGADALTRQSARAELFGWEGVSPLRDNAIPEAPVAKFKWHADYFNSPTTTRASVSMILQADNADQAERLARTELGPFRRVEVRRMGTAAPIRVTYAGQARDIPSARAAMALPIAS
jgi:hypothetical protein